jgi:hypothetical protein
MNPGKLAFGACETVCKRRMTRISLLNKPYALLFCKESSLHFAQVDNRNEFFPYLFSKQKSLTTPEMELSTIHLSRFISMQGT